jgi:hypothetical protein
MQTASPGLSSAIIIFGMHRSGTSLLGELVNQWGGYGQETALTPGDAWNPRGYWEFAPLVRFNDEILGLFKSCWNVPPDDATKPLLAALAEDPYFRGRALDLLATMRGAGRPWFWKDPRLSILLPFWKQLWGNVLYLVPIRDPGAIAASLDRRDSLSPRASLLLWHRYMTEIVQDDDVRSTGVFLNYEHLLADPQAGCRSLCSVLDHRLGTRPPDPDNRPSLMAAIVEPRPARSCSHAAFPDNPLATRAEKSLYRVLRGYSTGNLEPGQADIGLQPQWRDVLTTEDLLQRAGISRARCQVYWRTTNFSYSEDQSHSVAVRMDGTPQHVEIPIPAQPSAGVVALRVDLADRPASVRVTALTVRDATERIVWTLENHLDLLAGLPKHEIGAYQSLRGEGGCIFRLDSFDSWIELVLTAPQSAAIEGSLLVDLHCTYSSSLEHILMSNAESMRRAASQMRGLEAANKQLEALDREYTCRITRLEDMYAELRGAFERSRVSRLRKSLAAIGAGLRGIFTSAVLWFTRLRHPGAPR